jgi:O-antigen/teichoic acid export membrane protein
MELRGRSTFVRMFGSAIVMQGMLSAASFVAGLILLRRTSNESYGHYVLIVNAILLIVAVQCSYFQPSIVMRMSHLDLSGRKQLIGGFLHNQQRLLLKIVAALLAAIALLFAVQIINWHVALLLVIGTGAVAGSLFREFFRLILFAYRRSVDVLQADVFYALILIGGVLIATLTAAPDIVAVATLGVAALIGGILQARALRRFEPWDPLGREGTLRDIASLGGWATAGAALHWAFSQGYSYIAAATLNVAALAAIVSIRLLFMPLNLVSTGIGTLMLPTATGWVRAHGAKHALRRLALIATVMAIAGVCYISVVWTFRDWIIATVIKKDFAHRDSLLILWSIVFVVMLFRDQLLQLPMSCGRYRHLAGITLASTIVALVVCHLALRTIGEPGAPLGVLAGEICNLAGIIALSLQEIRNERNAKL